MAYDYIDSFEIASVTHPVRDAEAEAYEPWYAGVDLTQKFSGEIAASPYSGDPWAWIQARIQAGNYTGIHISDWIPFTANGYTYRAQVAGVNLYKGYGATTEIPPILNHIDFISRELWAERHSYNRVAYNNGTAAAEPPWLASDLYHWLNSLSGTVPSAAAVGGGTGTAVDYRTGGVYYYLPQALKDVIVEKRLNIAKRYSASELLTDDAGNTFYNVGKLWVPSEWEVIGGAAIATAGELGAGGHMQYPIFAAGNRVRYRSDGTRDSWWTMNARAGNATSCVRIYNGGTVASVNASVSTESVPICFRIAEVAV